MELESDHRAKSLGWRLVTLNRRPREQRLAEIVEGRARRQDRAHGEAGGLEQPAHDQSALGQEEAVATYLPVPGLAVRRDARVGVILDERDGRRRHGGFEPGAPWSIDTAEI